MGLYKENKNAKVGTLIECPICHTKFRKIQYSQAFCCGHCKDKFHNRHDGDRHKYNMSDDVNDWLDNDQWGDMELGIHE
jgi:hypothetical protein